MTGNFDIHNDNECIYEIDENNLSLLRDLISRKYGDMSHSKMDLNELSADEADVMRIFSLLGDIVVNNDEFNAWLGNQHSSTIDSLVQKELIQKQDSLHMQKLFLTDEVRSSVRNKLKPSLQNCTSIKKLCESAAQYMSKQAMSQKREKPGEYVGTSDLTSHRHKCLSRLVLQVLSNLEYIEAESISFCIECISMMISDDVDRMTFLERSEKSYWTIYWHNALARPIFQRHQK